MVSRVFSQLHPWAILLVVASLLVSAVSPHEAQADPNTSAESQVEIIRISPAILTDQTEIKVTAHLRSLPDTDTARVALFMGADSLTSQDRVDAFLENGGYVWNVAEIRLSEAEREKAATASGVEVTLTAGVAELPLWNADDWGPYGVEVRTLSQVPGSFTTATSARSLLLWFESSAPASLHLNVIAPRLQVAGLGRIRGVTTPLTEAEILALDSPGLQGGEVLLLPTANADLSVISAAGASGLAELARQSLESGGRTTEDPSVVRSFLTSQEWFSAAIFEESGGFPVLSPPGGMLTGAGQLPPGKYSVANGSIQSDASQGRGVLVQSWHELETLVRERATTEHEIFQKQQRIRALTALEAKALGSEIRYVTANVLEPDLSTLPAAGEPTEVEQALQTGLRAALESPWVTPVSLQAILDGPFSVESDAPLPTAPTGDQAALRLSLAPVESAFEMAAAVLESADPKETVPSGLAAAALTPAGAGLNLEEREKLSNQVSEQIRADYDVIDITPSRTVNILSNQAELPITLSNRGDIDIEVTTGIRVSDPRLRADEQVRTVVPAHSSATANIPIVALGSGNISATVEVSAANGTLLDSSEDLLVRTRPWLGDTLTWVVGSALAALFVVGLYRTLRHGRRGVGLRTVSPKRKDGG